MPNKDVAQLLRQVQSRKARREGWTVRQTGKHHHVILKNNQPIATLSSTPSDCREVRNVRARLKRAGFSW